MEHHDADAGPSHGHGHLQRQVVGPAIMDRKAPPQAPVAEVNSKLPALSMPIDTNAPPSKKIKISAGNAVAAGADTGASEVIDVTSVMNLQRGDCIEVKWTINDDDEMDTADNAKSMNEYEKPKDITVWWAATLCEKTGTMHTLTHEESKESEHKSTGVQVPIYTLNYSPLEEHGFEAHSLEDVAFISNRTVLNLSTDEMMTFRKRGEPSPPPSPTLADGENIAGTADSVISREFASQDEIGMFMDQLMQQCLKSTGMDKKMGSLPVSEQMVMADRISKAKEGFLVKMMEETDKMEAGNKVINAEVVNRCMAQMKGAY